MERHVEREKYYLEVDYKTEVTPDWLKHGDYKLLHIKW